MLSFKDKVDMIRLPHVKAKNGTGPLEYIKHARLS